MRLSLALPPVVTLILVSIGCAQSTTIDDDDGTGGARPTTTDQASTTGTSSNASTSNTTSSVVSGSATATASSVSVSASTGNPDPCGNGTIDVGEECDDANPIAADGCTDCIIDCDVAAGELKAAANLHCYRFVTAQLGWAAAEADCVTWGKGAMLGHLASIGDAVENTFVQGMAGAGIWIGASDTAVEGNFVWSDGTPFAFTAWAGGEPNDDGTEDCALLQPNGLWRDSECGNDHVYVCERHGAGE